MSSCEQIPGADERVPLTRSLLRFVSDFVGGEDNNVGSRASPSSQQPNSADTQRSATVIEMRNLFDAPGSEVVSPESSRAIHQALQEWKSISNIDSFLESVYSYYRGRGMYCIFMSRLSSLLILAFVVFFSLFLIYAIDWQFLYLPATAASHPKLSKVVHWAGLLQMSPFAALCLLIFFTMWIWQMIRLVRDLPHLARMERFYTHLLDIKESELHSIEFSDIIEGIVQIQKDNPISIDRLNAYDVSNRIMRRENYLIALFNKELLNLRLPLPLPLQQTCTLTKTLEWNLSFCILNYAFDENCSVRRNFLKNVRRDRLVFGLKKRFMLMGIVNLAMTPFIFVYLLVYFFFRYGEEIYRNPKTIGSRQYTTGARWKLREFNELPHYFDRRLANSHRKASKYMAQFHSDRLASFARLASFVTGSFAVVLIMITIINEDLLMHFEITTGKSVIWYIGLFGALLAMSRALIPDESQSYDPAKLMSKVITYTHYLPKHWRGRLHTEQVRREFSPFFDYKFSILFRELFGVLTTPFILMFSLPDCADKIVEFFREFTVHVDGIGYVCSFALFDFKRHGNPHYGGELADKYHRTRQGKMEKSFLSFVANNPNWTPNQVGSRYLRRLYDFEASMSIQQQAMAEGANRPNASLTCSMFFRKPLASLPRRASPKEGEPFVESLEEEQHDASMESLGVRDGIITILNQYYEHQSNH